MATAIITDKFRIENAKKFVQSFRARSYPADFSTTQSEYERVKSSSLNNQLDNMYMFIGKITSWYEDGDETPVPDVSKDFRDESEVWDNALAAKKIQLTDVKHVVPRTNWTNATLYPYFRSDASNTATFGNNAQPNFFVLDENEFRVYKCLFNYYGSVSTQAPTLVGGIGGDSRRIQREPFETNDGYVWKYMYTIDPSEAQKFLTDNYMPVRKDTLNDNGSSTDNSTADGAIYRILVSSKTTSGDTVLLPSGGNFARVPVTGVTKSTRNIEFDLTGANRTSVASQDQDDMVGYQIEHVIDDGSGNKTLEIGKITASSISGSTLTLDYDRVDTAFDTDFAVGTIETWFIAPYIEIVGEGENASALIYINGETGFDTDLRKLFPNSVTPVTGALFDVIMNTNGTGYRNIFGRNDTDGSLNSVVFIRQGESLIGSSVNVGDDTFVEDRDIEDYLQIASVTPYGGHSYDNISELYGFTIMINQTFDGDESGNVTVQNDFRKIALVQNPLEQGGTIADASIYRQTIRLEFNGDLTGVIDVDDEIGNNATPIERKTVYGRVVELEYDGTTYTKVFLSSAVGFFDKTAQEIYDLDPTGNHRLYLTLDVSSGTSPFTALTLSARTIVGGSDGEFQKGLGSGTGNPGLEFLSGDMFYLENRQPVIRATDQAENIKLIIEY
jgi:hypothetical protein